MSKRNTPKLGAILAKDDYSLLSDDDRARITAEAQAEAEGDLKARQIALFKKQARRDARVAAGLMIPADEVEIRTIVIDVAGHADRITLDSTVYYQGFTYDVDRPVFDTLNEIMARTWIHEDEIGGANRDAYRKPRGNRINMRTGAVV